MKVPKVNEKNASKDLLFIINTKPDTSKFCTVILTVSDITMVTLSRDTNRELKQRRRRRERERQKKAIGFDFLCRHFSLTTRKCLISRFVEDGNTRQQLSFSFPEL